MLNKSRLFCTLGTLLVMLFPQQGLANMPDITAKAAIVIEASTGKVLYAKSAEERHYPASTTKMITLIVALENGQLDDIVTASPTAANTEGSSLELSAGEQLKLREMLYGIMLISGNDATVAVAEHIAGSVENFAKMMTAKAHTIGAKDTNFANSSGLPDVNHYTTAHDLARIAAYGYKNPMFKEIVSTKTKIIPWAGKEYSRELFNENRMLWLYDGANGVKTGYTDAAGRCLVSAAERGGIQLIAVVLDSEQMWDDSIKLLDYGFPQLKTHNVFQEGDIFKTVRVTSGTLDAIKLVAKSGLTVPIAENEENELHTAVEVSDKITAPITQGQKLGIIRTYYKDTEIAATDLIADQAVERKSFFALLWKSVCSILAVFWS
ncbi:MAG: D-alanyl-D-alanine carboxypeptidase [Pelosinus sp.]|nr:D-alanyl-D-alanine carboxypeptidase [Pelosinus sp.]